jgi:phasin family protein
MAKTKIAAPKLETPKFDGTSYETVISASKEQMEKALKATTEAAERAFTVSKERLDAVVKGYDDAAKFSKTNVDAIVAAGNVATKGAETINAEVLAFAKSQYEDNLAATKALFGAKTLQELIELQNDFAKTAFEAYAAHATKLSEVTAKVAQDTFAPINAQVQVAVEKFVKPLAA